MATLVCFHAHPDDEAIATGGLMAQAVADGHRVVLVVATRGEMGEPVEGVLDEGEKLGDRRSVETQQSADVLGVHRVEFLGYRDSGMMGEPSNDDPTCFWQADRDEAAARLEAILTEEGADVLTVYDDHGGYGHPDHIQVHRVGIDAAKLAGVHRVFWSTMNRTRIQEMLKQNAEMAEAVRNDDEEASQEGPASVDEFGTPEEGITHAIDVSAFVAKKRASMAAHASQISEDTMFLTLPDEVFTAMFGTEWFIDPNAPRTADAPFATSLFD